jgi:flagella basal body P-ring formation protein FlgA
MLSLLCLLSLSALASAAGTADPIRAAVAAQLGVDEADVEVRSVGTVAGLPDGDTCAVQLPRVGAVTGLVPVTLHCGAGRWQTHAYVEVWRSVPVAVADTRAGERVEVRTERVSSYRLHGEEPVADVGTWTARVDLEAGAPLTTTRVRPAPDLERGSPVRLVAGGNGLRITADGELLQEGWHGRPVSVLNLSTRTVLEGVYAGDSVVTLGTP